MLGCDAKGVVEAMPLTGNGLGGKSQHPTPVSSDTSSSIYLYLAQPWLPLPGHYPPTTSPTFQTTPQSTNHHRCWSLTQPTNQPPFLTFHIHTTLAIQPVVHFLSTLNNQAFRRLDRCHLTEPSLHCESRIRRGPPPSASRVCQTQTPRSFRPDWCQSAATGTPSPFPFLREIADDMYSEADHRTLFRFKITRLSPIISRQRHSFL